VVVSAWSSRAARSCASGHAKRSPDRAIARFARVSRAATVASWLPKNAAMSAVGTPHTIRRARAICCSGESRGSHATKM